VPVVVRETAGSEALELALIENIHRKDLNPIEEAKAYERLLAETGATQDVLADRLGKQRSTITNLLRLLRLPGFIQKDVMEGRLTMGHARVLAGLTSPQEQRALWEAILEKGLSVRQAEAHARKRKNPSQSRGKSSEKEIYLKGLADSLKRSLGTRVEIQRRGRKGRIVVHFSSDEELDRLLDLFT
jgi:ParB family chromosome partitioning protein